MKLSRLLLSLGFLVVSSIGFAQDIGFYQIDAVELREVETPSEAYAIFSNSITCESFINNSVVRSNNDRLILADPIDEVGSAVDKIINIGKKVWSIVEAGKPVLGFSSMVATALPLNVKCWDDLAQWEMPQAKRYQVVFKNLYGMNVVVLDYRLTWLYGGNLKGKGKYIGYASVTPVTVSVAWGFSLDAHVAVPTVFNMGTDADPVAGMQVNVTYKVASPLSKIEGGQSFNINAKGELQVLP